MINNKYAICFSLYDNLQLSETNLYYYKGIISALCIINRNFDIYIDTTPYCKSVLDKIIRQEELCTDNVYYNIHDTITTDNGGMLLRYKTMFDNCLKYDGIKSHDSDMYLKQNIFSIIDKRPNYSIYNNISIYKDNIRCMYWGLVQYVGGGCVLLNGKKLNTSYLKLQNVMSYIMNNTIKKYYEFDEFFISSLLIKEFITNNILWTYQSDNYDLKKDYINYLTNIEQHFIEYYTFNKLKYISDQYYILNNKKYLYNNVKPQCAIKQESLSESQLTLHKNRNKYLFLKIQKYMLDYIQDFDINELCFNYE